MLSSFVRPFGNNVLNFRNSEIPPSPRFVIFKVTLLYSNIYSPFHFIFQTHSSVARLFSAAEVETCLSSGNMQCNITKKCVPLSWKCDGENDCGEGDQIDTTDENNCGM